MERGSSLRFWAVRPSKRPCEDRLAGLGEVGELREPDELADEVESDRSVRILLASSMMIFAAGSVGGG